MSFVFYDTETTGISTAFDQILQFGAILTDGNLNILERFEIRSQIQPHVIMSPGAMLVTGVSFRQARDQNLPSHYDMVRIIREKLSQWSPAIFIGYNSIAFDEELLRQALYQTLHDPFITNKHGNQRGDAMQLIKGVAQFAPECLTIPKKLNGKPNFKLDALSPANGFNHQNAHDAMADVEALIHLCRIISDTAPEEWSQFIRFSQKAACEDYLSTREPILVSEYYSFGTHKHFPVVLIGKDLDQPNKHLCYDLSYHPNEFDTLDDQALVTSIKRGPKPLLKVKINAAPSLRDIYDVPAWSLGTLTVEEIEERSDAILENETLIKRLLNAYENAKEEYPVSEHVEENIYSGFPSSADSALMERFHKNPWEHRAELIDHFEDKRFSLLAARLIYIHEPELLPAHARLRIKNAFEERINFKEECSWGTIPKAIAECSTKLPELVGSEAEMLSDYQTVLQNYEI